jgi:gamma-glutamyl-gamma-aminobutyrate hydrolase PuuD
LSSNKPKIGIGRGAHLLNMYNGGSSWQSVDNHLLGTHRVTNLITGNVLFVTSEHWQVMRPTSSADILCVADVGKTYKDDQQEYTTAANAKAYDIEACFYSMTNSLCFQPSPDRDHTPSRELLYELAHEFLILEKGCTATFN